ncbi:MAG: transcription elongation factor GreA [Deltaproteobacteria bacterium]
MAGDRLPMTLGGLTRLKEELKRIKSVDRPQNVRDIETARAHGDLSENAEYHAAKEKQGILDGRMKFIEDAIARAEVIDVRKLSGDRVKFGATVVLQDADTEAKVRYRLVGELEADLKQGRISVTSPIARALIGREVGELVMVQAPGGAREYEILELLWLEDPVAAE